jgi:hypothetical protein
MQADLRGFVTNGLSMVSIRATAFMSGNTVLSRVPSGQEISGAIQIVNPQNLDVTYSLSWNVDDACFSVLPPSSPTPSDPTSLTIQFTLCPKAEHKTITFTLGKYVASLNKKYDNDNFSIICDSPPDPAQGLVTAEDASQKAFLAFVLPSGPIDDDLASVELTWHRVLGGSDSTATYPVTALTSVPAKDPIGDGSALNRYFCPNIDPGYAYAFSVVVVDAAGQKSSPASVTSVPHPYTLAYDGNGSDGGTAPASSTHAVEDTITVADCGSLYKTGYAFVYWNSAADGSGTIYRVGSSFAMGAADLRLYAQWAQNGTIVSFDIGTQGLSFTTASATIARGSTLVVSCGNSALASGGTGWKWYVDGVQAMSQTTSSFDWNTSGVQPGQYEIGCTVDYEGLSYSGSFRATVTY